MTEKSDMSYAHDVMKFGEGEICKKKRNDASI